MMKHKARKFKKCAYLLKLTSIPKFSPNKRNIFTGKLFDKNVIEFTLDLNQS